MIRFPQPEATRGSQKWLQRAVNQKPEVLNSLILPKMNGAASLSWRSPLVDDEYAEYRDSGLLKQIGTVQLTRELGKFWPDRGPQWDGLATSDQDDVLLVEAKAHIEELCSSGAGAGPGSLK